MLQSFIVTLDRFGLRSVIPEHSQFDRAESYGPACARCWAVIDSEQLLPVLNALELGRGAEALALLAECAFDTGPACPRFLQFVESDLP